MQTVLFDGDGGPISAEVRCGFANPGSYVLRLWEKDSNKKAMSDIEGNFINADDDRHPLPVPALTNDGRIVETFVTMSPPAGTKQFFASLRIIQDNQLLADVSVSNVTDQHSVTVDLFVKLAPKPVDDDL
jgi:hypothetical protein